MWSWACAVRLFSQNDSLLTIEGSLSSQRKPKLRSGSLILIGRARCSFKCEVSSSEDTLSRGKTQMPPTHVHTGNVG